MSNIEKFGEKTNNWSDVYFIQGKNGGPIKIGHTDQVDRRIKLMQTGNPDLLNILHVTHGGKIFEDELHTRFKEYHYRGEWFKPEQELLDFIEQIKMRDINLIKRQLSVVEFALGLGEFLTTDEKKLLQELVNGEKFAPGAKAIEKYKSILNYYNDYLVEPDKYDKYFN